jgi:hypothetical protein
MLLALRTDRKAFRRLVVDDPVMIELREWSAPRAPVQGSIRIAVARFERGRSQQ